MATLQERLTPSQAKILQSDIPFLWMRAGYGAGKTRSIAQFVTDEMLQYPGCYGCCYNNTGGQLASSTWDAIKIYWLDKGISWKGPGQASVVTIPNGSRLKLQTMAVQDEQFLAGPEWSFIAIDEAHKMKQPYWDVVKVRARRKHGSRKVRVYGLSENPAHYLVQEFVKAGHPGYGSIEFTTYENARNMPEDQIAKYEVDFPPGTERHKRYMLGQICAVEGTCYPQLVGNLDDYLIDADQVPESAKLYIYGQDLGTVDPHVLLEGRLSLGDVLYITREYYQGNMNILKHIPALRDMWVQGPIYSDHSAERLSILEDHGFNIVRAYKSINAGIDMVHRRLNLHGIKIVRTCTNLIREICSYKLTVLPSGKEVPEHEFSHCPDALRYMICGLDGHDITAGL